eukprot:4128950-Amphidinium_carterae.3
MESLICGEIKNQSSFLPWKGEVGRPSEGGRTRVSPRASVIGNSSGSKLQSPPGWKGHQSCSLPLENIFLIAAASGARSS